MYYNSNSEIEELVHQFETKSLPKACWTHNAHLTVGIYYLYHTTFYEAVCNMKAKIITYNESTGGINSPSSGYHETLTVFWLKIIDNYLSQKKGRILFEICNEFLVSPFSHKDLPLHYYSQENLFSINARAVWTIPDKKSL